MRGRPFTGRTRRTSIGGLKILPKCEKRGAKSVISTTLPNPSVIVEDDDGGVLEIGLFAAFHADLIDGEDAPLIRIRAIGGTIEKAEENRVAVEIRKAAPDDLRPSVDEGGDHAISNDGQIERHHPRATWSNRISLSAQCARHRRKSAGEASRPRATVFPSPILIEKPP